MMNKLFPSFAKMSGSAVTVGHVPKKTKKRKPSFMRFSTVEQAHFAKRLAMVLRSGIPIMEGLTMLSSQYQNRSSSYIYAHLMEQVSNGQTLSGSMQAFNNIFGDFCINIVRVGEASG